MDVLGCFLVFVFNDFMGCGLEGECFIGVKVIMLVILGEMVVVRIFEVIFFLGCVMNGFIVLCFFGEKVIFEVII